MVNDIIDDKQLSNNQIVSKVKDFYLKYDVLKVAQESKNDFYNKSMVSSAKLISSRRKKENY